MVESFSLRRRGLQALVVLVYFLHFTSGFGILCSTRTTTLLPKEPICNPSQQNGEEHQITANQQLWDDGIAALQDPGCCVVSICSPKTTSTSLDSGLKLLQHELAEKGPSDIDMRTRINTTTIDSAFYDCSQAWSTIFGLKEDGDGDNNNSQQESISVLAELARGISSFERGRNEKAVYMRIVCASSYRAHDPVYHTDKCPLRGYVTLRGVGTEFVTHPCSPLEYMGLRSLGRIEESSVRCAKELEFIVMKGDYYYDSPLTCTTPERSPFGLWQRAFACVHRSPPGGEEGGRRVIVSFDLADGDDDREWHDVGQKRQWRSGMTQRKSRLVA